MFSWILAVLTWWAEVLRKHAERIALRILSAGPIPRHVAFIMDGNRRYARERHINIVHGHSEGFQTLRRLLEVCLNMNIHCVTVYAFSIENFKRSPEEVDALMKLAKDKLYELCKKGDLLDEYGVRLCVLGRVSMLPEDVQEAVRHAEGLTRHNSKAILNLCMPYTSRDEMASAVRSTIDETLAGARDIDSITESTIDAHLMTSKSGSPPLDILVRTSGVRRLSDFMLWQCAADTQIQFISCYWPDFGIREFLPIILDYQRKVWSRRSKSQKVPEEQPHRQKYASIPGSL